MVGTGILGLPCRVFTLAGPTTPCAPAAACALGAAVALCLAELASRFDGAGGPDLYLYLYKAFRPSAG